jgi:hypothetical protein
VSIWTGGKRKGVHEDRGVSRASLPLFRGQCHFGQVRDITQLDDAELARILRDEPRRLCGHCFPVVDR